MTKTGAIINRRLNKRQRLIKDKKWKAYLNIFTHSQNSGSNFKMLGELFQSLHRTHVVTNWVNMTHLLQESTSSTTPSHLTGRGTCSVFMELPHRECQWLDPNFFYILTPNHRPFSRSPVFRLFFRRDKWIAFAIFSPLIWWQVTHRCHSSGSFSSSICSCEQVWTSSRRCLHHFANIRRLVKLTKFAVYYLQCYYGWIIGNTVNSFSANLF